MPKEKGKPKAKGKLKAPVVKKLEEKKLSYPLKWCKVEVLIPQCLVGESIVRTMS